MTPYFFIYFDKQYIRIDCKDIRYLESRTNFVMIVMDRGQYLVNTTLTQLVGSLPFDEFAQVNRSTVVALAKIISFDRESVIMPGKEFVLTGKYRSAMHQKISILVHPGQRVEKSRGAVKTMEPSMQAGYLSAAN
jgi:DNA-binding LytR/AlgR family response regulator